MIGWYTVTAFRILRGTSVPSALTEERGRFIRMKRVYIKEEVCIGCHLCEVYCRAEHSQSKDLVKAFKRESPPSLPRLWLWELMNR